MHTPRVGAGLGAGVRGLARALRLQPSRRSASRSARIGVAALAMVATLLAYTQPSSAVVDVTGPVIDVTLNPPRPLNGWYNTNVSLTWSVTDPESTPTIVSGCVNRTLSVDTALATYSCDASSAGGLAIAPGETTIGRDATKPVINPTVSPAPVDGWNTTDVTVSFVCTDALSGVASNSVAGGTTVTAEGSTSVTNSGGCTDNAGNVANASTVTVKIDKSAPTAVLTVTAGTAGTNGWYTSNLTVAASGVDAGSGGVVCTTPAPGATQTTDTAGTTFTASCTNAAGLTTAATPLVVKLDKTGPTLAPTFSTTTVELLEQVSLTPHATDATSGVASESCGAVVTTAAGHFTATCTAKDNAGNTTTTTVGYDVIAAAGTVLFGTKPPTGGGFGTFAFGGGSFEQLLSASGCPRGTSVFFFNRTGGTFAVWIPGASVDAANAEVLGLFTGTPPIPVATIFTARCV